MARFKPGQEIVCVEKQFYYQDYSGHIAHGVGPKYNEIVTVESYKPNTSAMYLVGYNARNPSGRICYMDDCFEPVINISELQSILESQPEYA